MRAIIVVLLSLLTLPLAAQHHPYGFFRTFEIPVYHHENQLQYAWTGGANSLYFSQIDLNNDNAKDLIAFEKHGNKILPFLFVAENDTFYYEFAPQYQHIFPTVHDWLVLADYNGDGKEDIFTYSLAGISVYENVTESELQFELKTETLLTEYYGSQVNLFASPDDYLAIGDVDGDGDLDVINFWVLGQNLHLQENIGTANSPIPYLEFRMADECWGGFSEAADGNEITLFTHCENKAQSDSKHIGSSIFLHDFNNDMLKDIAIGDVDYPYVTLLQNGGTLAEALMVSQTTHFPNAIDPISFYSMPAFNLLDINSDGKKELLASPSDPSLTKSIDKNSVWMYSQNNNEYVLETKAFLQQDMVDVGSGAMPVWYDWNGDGLLDLFVANYGAYDTATVEHGMVEYRFESSIAYYENIGTENTMQLQLVTEDFGALKQYKLLAIYPAFGDVNNDGKVDLLCGNSKGNLLFFENISSDEAPQFLPPQNNYWGIDVGDYSTPQWFDLNNDGKDDLIIGNRRGLLAAYENVGTSQQPSLQHRTDTLGEVDVRDFTRSYHGYSVPCFYREGGQTTLFCGAEDGFVYIYPNVPTDFETTYNERFSAVETLEEATYFIKEGVRSAPAVAMITQQSYPDLFVGNWAGGVAYFQGDTPQSIAVNSFEKNIEIELFPNPATNKCTIIIPENKHADQVVVYNAMGIEQLCIQAKQSQYEISVDQWHAGVYVVVVVISGERMTKKMVVL